MLSLGGSLISGAASGAASFAAPYAESLGKKVWGENEDTGAVSKKYQHRCPLLCFLDIAVLTLGDPHAIHNMKIDVHKTTIDRCPASPGIGIVRWFKGQGRDKLAELVDDAVRAARLYDPNEDTEFGQSVNFLYRKTIEGLKKIESTYANGKDKKSDLAVSSIVMTQKILELMLEGLENEDIEDDESSSEIVMGRDYFTDFHIKLTREELKQMMQKQKLEEEETQKSGLWTTDSTSFWIVPEDGVDELTPVVKILRNLDIMNEKNFKERKHKQYSTKFENTLALYELMLKIIKANYWKNMH